MEQVSLSEHAQVEPQMQVWHSFCGHPDLPGKEGPADVQQGLQALSVPRQGLRVWPRLAAAEYDGPRAEESLPPAAAPATPVRSFQCYPPDTTHPGRSLAAHARQRPHPLNSSQCSPPLYRHAMHPATGCMAMSHVDVQVPCRHTDIQALSSTCQRTLTPLRCRHAQPGIADRVTGATPSSGSPPNILPCIAMRPCGRTRAAHGSRSRCADVARWSSPAQPAR